MSDRFTCHLDWSGSARGPTSTPHFSRDLEAAFSSGFAIPMSAAPAYKGDPSRLNPEELLVAALSACHALTFLYVAARGGVSVVGYMDDAEGRLAPVDGRVRLSEVTLRPVITLGAGADEAAARGLVEKARAECFIANSLTSLIRIEPTFTFG